MTLPIGTTVTEYTRSGERVSVVGEIRINNRVLLRNFVFAAFVEHGRAVLDLRRAPSIDSSGIAVLYTLAQYARVSQMSLVIANAPADFRTFVEETPTLRALLTFEDLR